MEMEQPWTSFSDPWISDIFTNETETLTKALQNSFSDTTSNENELIESLFAHPKITPVQTPTISGGSEYEVPVPKQRRSIPPSGRVAKRKSRASKHKTTTFITADPANFRQMVQQVTGGQFHVLKPVPHRAVNGLQQLGGNGFPMLDASSFFVEGSSSPFMARSFPRSTVVADGVGFESFCNFPTLESWKV